MWKKFSYHSQLLCHSRTHTGENPSYVRTVGKFLLVLIVFIIVVFTLKKKHLYVRTMEKDFINSSELTQHSPIYWRKTFYM